MRREDDDAPTRRERVPPDNRRYVTDGGRPPGGDESNGPNGDGDATEATANDTEPQDGSDSGSGDGPDRAPPGSRIDRRTLIRILLVVGLGIPILIEGRTLLGLIMQNLDGDGGETTTTRRTTTQEEQPVGIGDELLPETPQVETIREGYVATGENETQFSMTVDIDNRSDTEYELRLESVTTESGTVVQGGASSGRLHPGDDGSVTGTWDLPVSDRPRSVDVIAISVPDDGDPTTVTKTIPLGDFPVERRV